MTRWWLRITIAGLILLAVGSAYSNPVVDFTPEQATVLSDLRKQAYEQGHHDAAHAVEEACNQDGKFQIQVGGLARSYRCKPDWI